MSTTAIDPVIAANRQPLLSTLLIALLLHALFIFGISFAPPEQEELAPPTLDVVLVQHKSKRPPEEADYLSRDNSDGSGNVEERVAAEMPRADPAARQQESTPVPPVTRAPPAPPVQPRQRVTTTRAPIKVEEKPADTVESRQAPPSSASLIDLSLQMARLEAGLDEDRRAYSKSKRQKFIDASTREHLYAAYMASWVSKVERFGNINYPNEARRRGLSGSLILDVALRPDGTIAEITLLRSSGIASLDQAAISIVRLAAPYARFPRSMREQVDLLHITKTWQFLSGNRWSGG